MDERRDDDLSVPVSHGGVWSNRGGIMFMPRTMASAIASVLAIAVLVVALVYFLA